MNDRILLDLLGTRHTISDEINKISEEKTTPDAVGHWKKANGGAGEIPMKWRIYVQRVAVAAGIIPPPDFLLRPAMNGE